MYSPARSQTSQGHTNYLGGLQFKNNSREERIKPFAHALAGFSRQTVHLEDFTDNGNTFDPANWPRRIVGTDRIANTGFSMQIGGGLDIRVNRRVDVRVIQFDLNPVKINDQEVVEFQQPVTGINFPNNLTFVNSADSGFTQYSPFDIRVRSRWQNNVRIGFRIVVH